MREIGLTISSCELDDHNDLVAGSPFLLRAIGTTTS